MENRRPDAIEIHDVRSQHLEEVKSKIGELVEGVTLEEDGDPLPRCMPTSGSVIPFKAKQADAEKLQAINGGEACRSHRQHGTTLPESQNPLGICER